MNIKQLIRENKEEILAYLANMAEKKNTKAPSIKLKFNALGKMYKEESSIDNYTNFIKDLSNIHPYETFQPLLKSFISRSPNGFTESFLPCVVKIRDNFYISKKLSNKLKIEHINKISETLNIPITFLND